MAAENFKVKKGLEVGTAITATGSGINVTGIVTATQFKGDGSGLTNVVGSGSGIVVKDEGSSVGTAGTINFVGSGVVASLSAGQATVTIDSGGLTDIVGDTTPQLGGNLDLNSKFITGTGGASITGVVTATTFVGNGDFVDLDVDGHTELDNVNISGLTTAALLNVNNLTNGRVTYAAAGGRLVDSANLTFDGTSLFVSGINVTGGGVVVDNVVGTALSISGISTFTGNIDANGNLDVDGQTDLDNLVVSGVGTFSTRIDTNGVSFGTNNNTFAAKFVDNAVANFGTDNDLKISHDDNDASIVNSKGSLRLQNDTYIVLEKVNGDNMLRCDGGGAVNLYFNGGSPKLVTTSTGVTVTGIVTATTFSGNLTGTATTATRVTVTDQSTDQTCNVLFTQGATGDQLPHTGTNLTFNSSTGQLNATKFSGDGSGLTGVTASGTGIIIQHDGSNVGTAGTINFSTNLDVTPIHAGIVTVTASGGTSGLSNIVEDTSPQLGGDLDVNGNEIVSASNGNIKINPDGTGHIQLQLAVGGDLEINGGGDTYFYGAGTNNYAFWDYSEGNLQFLNNVEAAFGSNSEMKIFHDDTNNIFETGTGQFIFKDTAGEAEFKIQGHEGNSATLYLFADEGDDPNDRWKTTAHTDGHLVLYHYKASTSAYAKSAQFTNDAGTQLFHTGVKRFETNASGVVATGICTANAFSGNLNASDLLSGEIPSGRFPATLPAASGANLTNLNADNISSGTLASARIEDEAITFAKMQHVSTGVLIGRNDSGTGDIETLSASDVRTLLNVADGATAGITTASSNVALTWDVVNSGGSAYVFTGPGQSSSSNPDIYLIRGNKYRFAVNAGGHPFYIKTSASTGTGNQYTTGVTNNGAETGNVEFYVPNDAPARLYYICQYHGSMVGNLYILGGSQTGITTTTFPGPVEATKFIGSGEDLTGLTATQIPNLNASKINAGTLGSDRIPNLAASKITSGTFDAARIPTLNQDTTGNAASADTIDVTATSNSSNYFVTFVDSAGSGKTLRGDSGIMYNPGSDNMILGGNLSATDVTASGELHIGSFSNISSGSHTFTASAGTAVTADSTAIGDATAIEYTIFISNGSNIQSQKVLIMDNGTTAYSQEFAVMSNPNMIVTFSADINGGNVRLRATPETGISGSTTIKFAKMTIE